MDLPQTRNRLLPHDIAERMGRPRHIVLFSLKGLHRLEVDSEELREALEEVELIRKDCPHPECESERQYVGPCIEGEHRVFLHPSGKYDTWEEIRAPLGGEEYMSFAAD